MALIKKENTNLVSKIVKTKQKTIKAEYFYSIVDGEMLFQINTYGSSTRQETEKASQIIQIDKEMAQELIKQLSTAFSL